MTKLKVFVWITNYIDADQVWCVYTISWSLRYVRLFNKRIIHYIEVKTVMFVIQAGMELFILYGTLKLQIGSSVLCCVLLFNLKFFWVNIQNKCVNGWVVKANEVIYIFRGEVELSCLMNIVPFLFFHKLIFKHHKEVVSQQRCTII